LGDVLEGGYGKIMTTDPTLSGDYTLTTLPPDIAAAIAQVAIEWSDMESALERLIWRLADIPYDSFGACITTHMPMSGRADAALALCKERHPTLPATADLERLIDVIRRFLSPLRNHVIHGRWAEPLPMYGDHFAAVAAFQARGELKDKSSPYTAKDLADVAARIARATHQLRLILGQYLTAREQALPGKLLVSQILVPPRREDDQEDIRG